MARSEVRHEAYDVLMDSRGVPEWLGEVVLATARNQLPEV